MNFGKIILNQNMVKMQNFCYMKTDSFIVHIKTNDIYKYTPEDVETMFSASNYELDRPFPRGEKKSNWINQR